MLAHSYPRFPGDVAGSFLGRLAEALVQKGHVVSVIVPADRGKADRFTLGGATVIPVRYASPEREDLAYGGDMAARSAGIGGAWTFWRLVRAMRAGARTEARRIGAQLVHAFWWVPGGWSAVGVGIPSIITLMGTDVAMMRSGAGRLLGRRVLARATVVCAISTFLADEARRLLALPDLEIDRVPVPVDVTRFEAPPVPIGAGIIYLGRLSKQKRVNLLLDAVKTEGLKVPVTIIGDGPARVELEEQARRLGLEQVRFLGQVPDADVPPAIRGAAVAAFLSENEGLGLAAAEALMMGTPVVATTDGGGVLDLVKDGEGACVVPPTPADIGRALARCLGQPALRAGAATAGVRLRRELSPEAVAAQFEDVYARII
jgi:glycosyltransferase involved in cell wall biosynthesis